MYMKCNIPVIRKKRVVMKKLAIVFSLSILGGCATSSTPNYFDGHYYMTGDASCVEFNKSYLSQSHPMISCYNKNGEYQGVRYAMTDADIARYRHNQQQQKIALQQSIQTLSEIGNATQQAGNQALQSQQSFSVPQVQSHSPTVGGQKKVQNCYVAGGIRYCQ